MGRKPTESQRLIWAESETSLQSTPMAAMQIKQTSSAWPYSLHVFGHFLIDFLEFQLHVERVATFRNFRVNASSIYKTADNLAAHLGDAEG